MLASNGNVAGTLGVLPVGSGSDFAHAVGMSFDLEGACEQLAHGGARLVDVCRVTVDDEAPQYFDNTVNIGFGGNVTLEARKVKWVRGMALYLPVVLKTVFLSNAPNVTITYDDQEMTLPAVMVCVGNGPREGGGFFSTPDAKPDDGLARRLHRARNGPIGDAGVRAALYERLARGSGAGDDGTH